MSLRDVVGQRGPGALRDVQELPAVAVIRRIGHDTSLFSKLVLGCIDSYDSEKWRMFSHFSRSHSFTLLLYTDILFSFDL